MNKETYLELKQDLETQGKAIAAALAAIVALYPQFETGGSSLKAITAADPEAPAQPGKRRKRRWFRKPDGEPGPKSKGKKRAAQEEGEDAPKYGKDCKLKFDHRKRTPTCPGRGPETMLTCSLNEGHDGDHHAHGGPTGQKDLEVWSE